MTMLSPTLQTLQRQIGQDLGISEWIQIDQDRIDAFARCTGDDQWIHVDVERAARESPYSGTIAHGYLTLSLLAPTALEVWIRPSAIPTVLNYGIDRVRFIAPVPSVVAPSMNVTVPVGVAEPPLVTVAVKVTEEPDMEGFAPEARAVEVNACCTVWVSAADVLPTLLPL